MENIALLDGPLARQLAEQREPLNARFMQHQRQGSRIDGAAFLRHLAIVVDPLVRAVAAVFPERIGAVTESLYEVSLDLFAANQLGPAARTPLVDRAWCETLLAAPRLLARDPRLAAACVSNAVVQLAGQSGVRPDFWLREMAVTAPTCDGLNAWLDVGKVLAWRAGMAQFRSSALEAAKKLPPRLCKVSLGLGSECADETLPAVLDAVASDPWLLPADAIRTSSAEGIQPSSANPSPGVVLVKRVGDFHGFDGTFARPPVVQAIDDHLLASDSEFVWQIYADVYGSFLHRTTPGGFKDNRFKTKIRGIGGTSFDWGDDIVASPQIRRITSLAKVNKTAAVTCGTSHFVFLFARQRTNGAGQMR